MPGSGLSSGDQFLIDSARQYIKDLFQDPAISVSTPIDNSLGWVPTLSFKVHNHLIIAAEVSEKVYPLIFRLRRLSITKLQIPISVYCVCPEEAYLADQPSAKELMADGYGLITVALDGTALRRASCIPLIQQITDEEFKAEIQPLPPKMRGRVAEAFDRYKHSAPSGTSDIAEVMEGLILRAGRDAAAKRWIAASDAKAGSPARTLAAMDHAAQFKNSRAAIGAAQAYISMYRNNSHHFPKDRKQAAQKYKDCRHGFLEGVKKMIFFRDSMRNAGLSGGL